MKTLVYSEWSPITGGIEIFARRQAEALRAAGRDVDCLDRLPADFSQYGEIFVHKCTRVRDLEAFPPEKATLYIHDHDPICPRSYAYTPLRHNCSRPGGLWPCLFCAPLCKSCTAALGRVLAQGRRKRAMARMARLVVLSDFMRRRLVANGIPAEKIEVRPPEIRLAPPSPEAAAIPDDVDLLYVGQLLRGKGVQSLLAAMARMARPGTLDVVGCGNFEPALRALAESLGVAGLIRWRGFQRNPQDWMRKARCVVVPSFWQEPYGLVAAEAVALGRPVVAFAIGGLPEACGGRATLVPPGDIGALAAALDAR